MDFHALCGQRHAKLAGVFLHRPQRQTAFKGIVAGNAEGEMGDVVNDKGENHDAGHAHGARGQRRSDDLINAVASWAAGLTVLKCKSHRRPNMNRNSGQQNKSHQPKGGAERLEEMGITVDFVG